MPFDVARRGHVFVLTMDQGDNRFNAASLADLERILDEVEHTAGPAALVTTGTGKFYSNGLDLDWVMQDDSEWDLATLAQRAHALFARTLAFPRPTIAAINGHCFAAGAMWSLAHDVRIMRSDRGFWSLPEVDIRIPFTPGMAALIQARLDKQAAHRAMATGARFGGAEAAELRIVDEAVPESDVVDRAVSIASELAGKDPATMAAIKQTMYGPALRALAG